MLQNRMIVQTILIFMQEKLMTVQINVKAIQ